MPLLNTFEFEIFLSYGWGGSTAPEEGARRWARQLRDWLRDKLAENVERPRIYLDDDAPRVGPVPDGLYSALDRSAFLVFLVSPWSYRENSWCQKEAAYFWDRARPLAKATEVLAPELRILKVIQSPPSESQKEPLPLRDLPAFELFDRVAAGGRETAQAANLAQPQSEKILQELDRLYATLRTGLERVRDLEKPENYKPSGKRVFLGPTFSDLDDRRARALRRELLLDGHEVRSVSPLPEGAETLSEHRWRLERSLDNEADQIHLAVHFVPRQQAPPQGWERNHAAQQIRHCLQKSLKDKEFSVFLWEDPDQEALDAECLRQIEEIAPTHGDQVATAMTYGDLKFNVKEILRKPPHAPPPPPVSFEKFDVVIQHHDVDSPEAARIREYIRVRHRLNAHFANPTLPKSNGPRRTKRNKEQYYQRAERFLVFYGRTDDEWTNEVCFAMMPHIQRQQRGLVLVAPPQRPPIGKMYYEAPSEFHFATKRCFDGGYEKAIDEWLGSGAGT